jgi:phosphatidylserine decarboxylase
MFTASMLCKTANPGYMSPMSIVKSIAASLVPIHREGWRFIAIFVTMTLFLFWLHWVVLAWIGVVASLWCAYFFRDPERVTPLRDGLVVSPADGSISAIEKVIPPPELDLEREPVARISVFMNVFNVHVNRSPADARIARITYIPGRFLNAELDKASEENERQALTLELNDGRKMGVVQIAGLIARRIVGFVSEGERLGAGQRFGLIRFGSRVDVYLPKGISPLVAIGQSAIAGETVFADLGSPEGERLARKS